MIQGQGQTTPHNTPVKNLHLTLEGGVKKGSSPASEEGDQISRLGLINQLVGHHPKVSPVWPQCHRELATHLVIR